MIPAISSNRALLLLLLTMAVIVHGMSENAEALPYDCPGTSTDQRKEYVCKMASQVGPELWNQWGQIRSSTIASYKRFQAGRKKCVSSCDAKLTSCSNSISKICKTEQCATERAQICQRRDDNCQNSCQTKSYRTNMRNLIRRGKPLATTFEHECAQSANAKACEEAEAKPFCSTLDTPISNYKQTFRSPKPRIGSAVDAFVAMMNATAIALNKRFSQLSDELRSGQYECAANDENEQNQQAGEENACILPQYKFNITLAALEQFEELNQKFRVSLPQRKASSLSSEFESGGPQLDLAGVTSKYCWNKKPCSDSFKLVQRFWPEQILNYFALPIGSAKNWRPGTVVAIGGQEFTIACIDSGAREGGSTACRPGSGSPASFDLIIVDDSNRPNRAYEIGSCVTEVSRQ